MKRIYLDSNVLISALKDEMDKNYRMLSIEARDFFEYAKKNNLTLVVSQLLLQEVKDKISYSKENTNEFLKLQKINIEEAEILKEDIENKKKFENIGIHYPDSLHITIAIRTKCNCIVTFNLKDFIKAEKFIEIKEPTYFK